VLQRSLPGVQLNNLRWQDIRNSNQDNDLNADLIEWRDFRGLSEVVMGDLSGETWSAGAGGAG
jgi:hypothetical protein